MSTHTTEIRKLIVKLTDDKIRPVINNVYRQSLKSVISEFSNLHYIDGNNNKIKVNCTYGNPERIAGKLNADDTLVLPMVTVVESQSLNDDDRRRYNPMLINESYWDKDKLRAVRILSLSPRPITITYEINIWSKYKADLDMLRSTIFSKFNPDMQINTEFSKTHKLFLTNESDIGSVTVNDQEDRVLQKTFEISLETYIDNPKFMITNTGEIKDINV